MCIIPAKLEDRSCPQMETYCMVAKHNRVGMKIKLKGFYIDPDLSKISVGIFTNIYTVKNYFDESSISVRNFI